MLHLAGMKAQLISYYIFLVLGSLDMETWKREENLDLCTQSNCCGIICLLFSSVLLTTKEAPSLSFFKRLAVNSLPSAFFNDVQI